MFCFRHAILFFSELLKVRRLIYAQYFISLKYSFLTLAFTRKLCEQLLLISLIYSFLILSAQNGGALKNMTISLPLFLSSK